MNSPCTIVAALSLELANIILAHPLRASSNETARPISEPAPVTGAYPGKLRADSKAEGVKDEIAEQIERFKAMATVLYNFFVLLCYIYLVLIPVKNDIVKEPQS